MKRKQAPGATAKRSSSGRISTSEAPATQPEAILREWQGFKERLLAANGAVLCQERGFPFVVMLAQLGLESGRGKHGIGEPGQPNNLMGMKYIASRHPGRIRKWTWEYFTWQQFARWCRGEGAVIKPGVQWLGFGSLWGWHPYGKALDTQTKIDAVIALCEKNGWIGAVSKQHQATGPGVKMECRVKDWFAAFPSLEAALRDYLWLVTEAGLYADDWSAYIDDT
ncbi:MAG: hypothetical protein ACKVQA_21140, partial [Burkholderiales bacterium]